MPWGLIILKPSLRAARWDFFAADRTVRHRVRRLHPLACCRPLGLHRAIRGAGDARGWTARAGSQRVEVARKGFVVGVRAHGHERLEGAERECLGIRASWRHRSRGVSSGALKRIAPFPSLTLISQVADKLADTGSIMDQSLFLPTLHAYLVRGGFVSCLPSWVWVWVWV